MNEFANYFALFNSSLGYCELLPLELVAVPAVLHESGVHRHSGLDAALGAVWAQVQDRHRHAPPRPAHRPEATPRLRGMAKEMAPLLLLSICSDKECT